MKRKIFLLASFFIATPCLILISLVFLSFLSFEQRTNGMFANTTGKIAFAALPPLENSFRDTIGQKDARTEIIRQFFAKYESPLEPYAQNIINAADTYKLDFRLLPAIAMQESNLCRKAPKNSYNCWGFGIYGGKVKRFNSYAQAINTVSKTLAIEYKNKGLSTPQEIVSKYTPSDTGKWSNAVSLFMNDLQ